MSIDSKTLRAQLADFRTRKEAINNAVLAGGDAAPAAIELLGDRKEAIRWSAIKILSDLEDTRAIGPLIELIEDGKSVVDAANALHVITGQDFGEDGAAWRGWASQSGGVQVATERKRMSDEELVKAAIDDIPAQVAMRKGRYVVTVHLDDGRSQTVYIVFSAKDSVGEPIVWLYTPCCEAASDKYEWALKQNLRLPHGAIGIARIDGKNCFVMSNTHLRATVDPDDIAKSLMTIAVKGDSVEKMLAGEDKR